MDNKNGLAFTSLVFNQLRPDAIEKAYVDEPRLRDHLLGKYEQARDDYNGAAPLMFLLSVDHEVQDRVLKCMRV